MSEKKPAEVDSKQAITNIANIAATIARLSLGISLGDLTTLSINFGELFSKKKRDKRKKQLEKQKVILLTGLQKAGVDPSAFKIHMNNEINRRLKKQYGALFFLFTFLFTVASYLIVVLNSVLSWNIPASAITALVIETPIQFVGILYIIARNLFPEKKVQ